MLYAKSRMEEMNKRADCDFSQHDENTPALPEQCATPLEQNSTLPAQLGQPEVEDCSNGAILYKAEPLTYWYIPIKKGELNG